MGMPYSGPEILPYLGIWQGGVSYSGSGWSYNVSFLKTVKANKTKWKEMFSLVTDV